LTSDGADPEQVLAAVCSVLGEMRRRDYYEVLGVRQGSSAGDIELAYRGLVAGWAPERFVRERPAIREAVAEIAALVDAAYRALVSTAAVEPASLDALFDDVEHEAAPVPPPVIDFGPAAAVPQRVRRETEGGGVSVKAGGGRWSAVKKLFRRG
jgi:hypothetical protein